MITHTFVLVKVRKSTKILKNIKKLGRFRAKNIAIFEKVC